jgi:hydroxymethylpyrimidine/phosphomethylpyrimidine kinase
MSGRDTIMRGRVLAIGGSDSSGGAGIQADVKTIMALGGYAMTAVTAVTVQDTTDVSMIHEVPASILSAQMASALRDIGADAIKTGMLGSASAVRAVADMLDSQVTPVPIVVDPVLQSSSGRVFMDHAAIKVLKDWLCLRATLLTPNIPEAEHLVGFAIRDLSDMKRAAEILMTLGPEAVLVKGGHMPGGTIEDVLLTADGFDVMMARRIDSRHTHGTGCTLASAIAVSLGLGLSVPDSVRRARAYVREAIRSAPGLGHGNGPLNHAHNVRSFGLDEGPAAAFGEEPADLPGALGRL